MVTAPKCVNNQCGTEHLWMVLILRDIDCKLTWDLSAINVRRDLIKPFKKSSIINSV